MFKQIKTSRANKDIVTNLTYKFQLGTENIIARIAIAYSLQSGVKFSPLDIKDSGGKEYSKNVLCGEDFPIYLALICSHYEIDNKDIDIPRYFKLHLDDGLEKINREMENNPNLIGYDFLFDKIHNGLKELC